MDPALRSLVNLQKLLNEQGELRRRYQEIPKEIEDLKNDREMLEERKKAHKEAFHNLEKREKKCESDLADTETAILKKQGTLHDVKTNKEYTAALHEIELLKRKKSDLEEEALTLMETIADDRATLKEEEARINEEEARQDARVREKEEQRKVVGERIREIAKLMPEQQKEILPQLLEQFKKLYYNRHGLALAPVIDDSCGGCMISLSPHTVNAAHSGDRIVTCDHCNRILYIEGDEENDIQTLS